MNEHLLLGVTSLHCEVRVRMSATIDIHVLEMSIRMRMREIIDLPYSMKAAFEGPLRFSANIIEQLLSLQRQKIWMGIIMEE